MKIRLDFVTNSSSSSFVCEICGETVSGWDLGYEDAGMFECVNGHVVCQEHMLDVPREKMLDYLKRDGWYNNVTKEELEEMTDEELLELFMVDLGELPEMFCPICQFEKYSREDMASYLLTVYKVPKEEVFAEIKSRNKRRRKLYDFEYIDYVTQKFNLDLAEIQASWREKYKTYSEFADSLAKF